MSEAKPTYVISADEWEQFQELKAHYGRILEASERRAADLLRLQEQLRALEAKSRAEYLAQGQIILGMQLKHTDQVSATRRACGQLVETLKLLQRLSVLAEDVSTMDMTRDVLNEWEAIVKGADEAVKLYGIPF